ncbi:hypothetical protein ASPFODRAFT_53964 [Aspergillus luchuensis CBS 106.47]|uniref:Uncharacterized protein n=1 Tax=Aspergillus luchuensis (strain CBS 106.47) TaxID=1137211 RepID=A0A1M3T008_ASPLC|nr:hypothetical protein ASPFODRAFT_53964 [Aspergillus luchuensis CBS 106.47]
MNYRTPSRANSVTVSASSPRSIAGHTRYIEMLLEVDHMPWIYNIIASVAHWVLLAGYLVIPGTFTSLQKSEKLEQALIGNGANKAGCDECSCGPHYSINQSTWSIMALVTTVMVGSAFLVSLSLTVLYKYVLLKKVEEEHEMEMRTRTPTSTDNHS